MSILSGLIASGCQTTQNQWSQSYKPISKPDSANTDWASYADQKLCTLVNLYGQFEAKKEAKRRNLNCMFKKDTRSGAVINSTGLRLISDEQVCASFNSASRNGKLQVQEEVTRRGLSCIQAVPQAASNQSLDQPTDNLLNTLNSMVENLQSRTTGGNKTVLKAKPQREQQLSDSDTQVPIITLLSSSSDDRRGSIAGKATDNIGIAEVRVDGAVVPLKSDGRFEWQGFVPSGGLSVVIEAIDTAGLSSVQQVRLERGRQNKAAGPIFARLDPFRGKTARKNRNALALVIGVADYKYTSDPALYADKDAEYFNDYAAIKLGVPDNNIFTITNTEADEVSIKKAVKNWLLRMSVKDETDVYVFFAGHGLASSDGSTMFLLPYDGDPELLEDSAIDRKQLFADIQAISPRSVTVFLDSCYSGGTCAGGTLVASLRPMTLLVQKQDVPDGFTILSAAKGDQTSQSLEEAKHGLFSYFLMRGLEGDADANNDNQITAGELHSYVTDKVERQSGFKQTPDLQGNAERVIARFE